MQLVVGLGLAGAGILLLLTGMRIFRRPQPPRWLQQGVVGDLVVVAVIGFITLGAGLIVRSLANWSTLSFGGSEALWGAAVLAVLLTGGWLLRLRGPGPAASTSETAGSETAGATVVSLAANGNPAAGAPTPDGRPSGRPSGRGSRKKRAA